MICDSTVLDGASPKTACINTLKRDSVLCMPRGRDVDIAAQRKRRKARTRAFVDSVLEAATCAHCGFSDKRALVFHHVRDKVKGVADMVCNDWSIANIAAEIEKCVVLCQNCHMIHHHEDGWAEIARAVEEPSPQLGLFE